MIVAYARTTDQLTTDNGPRTNLLEMRLWIDLANSPHVPFFNALRTEFLRLGHEIEITARDFSETVGLAEQAGLSAEVIGGFGGGKVAGKAGNLAQRAFELARGRGLDDSILPSVIIPTRRSLQRARWE